MTINRLSILTACPGEPETLEFKETTGTRYDAAMIMCAFLNLSSGQVLFGMTQAEVVDGQKVKALLHKLMTEEIRMEELGLA